MSPVGWPLVPLRRLGRIVGGGTPTSDPLHWDGDIPFVTPPDLRPVVGGIVTSTERFLTSQGALNGSAVVPPGSVLLSIRAPIGYVARTGSAVAFNQGCRAVVPNKDVDARFLTYALISAGPALESEGRGTTFLELSASQLSAFRVPVPPKEPQRAIADYLDRETAKIDTLITKQETLIATLRERRAAVITHAIFDMDAPISQLGHVAETLPGWAFPSDGFTSDSTDVRLLRGINIKPGSIDWSETVYWNTESNPVPEEFVLLEGDLVLGMDRPFVGGGVRVAAVGRSDTPALLLQRVMRIRAQAHASPDYLRYVFLTGAFMAYLEPEFTGVSVPHISEWQVRKFKLPLPTLDEQLRVAAHLDIQAVKIDTLIARAEQFIALAKERRSALITAAVTGQIDVPGAA